MVSSTEHLINKGHATIEIAASRLADASLRHSPRDRLIDAVIGLEAILLFPYDERSSLSLRFSLNYAFLGKVPASRDARFKTAKGIYNLRSRIAHGNEPAQKELKIAGNQLTIAEAANLAADMLRTLLVSLLPNAAKPPYLAEGYWDTLVLRR